ncbi:MAG TPA: FAD-dependent monooxygenase, partial [Casimicrobiaceae bacterium]|nr:FAD-dependent monooxygenase [Casimicrobiaceae bacterium]
ALGLDDILLRAGIENAQSCFFNRFGQLIYSEPRGKAAGYDAPEVGIHRGRLQAVLYRAVVERLGADRVVTNHTCVGVDQDERRATARFTETTSGRALDPIDGAVVIGCDGIHSAIRRQLFPGDDVAFSGINTWRGVTRMAPILDGRSYIRIGSILTGKMVIYPIANDVDDEDIRAAGPSQGANRAPSAGSAAAGSCRKRGGTRQRVNWLCEIQEEVTERNDWNKPGRLDDFYPRYANWTFDWLDAAAMIRNADAIYEYPMVDKDPLDRWTFGRVTLAGDAAHPMYPRGSNGAAQAAIDARTLADLLKARDDPRDALVEYERLRRPVTSKIVQTNREFPPDFINIKVEQLVGDRPFTRLDDFVTQDELRALSDEYKRVAGFARPS